MQISFIKYLKSSLVKDTFIYTITDAIGKAIAFLILPLISYYLSPDELGVATNFSVLTSIVTLLAGLAIVNSLPYFFYEQTKEQNRSLISNLLILCFICCIGLLALTLIFNVTIFNYLKLDIGIQALAILYVFATLINSTSLLLFRLEDKAKTFAKYQITFIILHCLLVILFVIIFKLEGKGKIYSEICTAVILSFIHIVRLIKSGYIQIKIERYYMITLIKFGLPLLPHSLSFWLKSGTDKIFITNFAGLYQNGLYSMALTINSIYSMFSNAFFQAYTPYLQKKLTNMTSETVHNDKRKIIKLSYLLIFILAIVAIFTIFCGYLILNFVVDPKYKESFIFVPYLIAGLWIYNVYQFSIQFIYKQKKTLIMGFITFTGALIQMLLSYILIKTYGAIGAAYSTIIGSLIISFGIFIYSNKVYPMPWLKVLKRSRSVNVLV